MYYFCPKCDDTYAVKPADGTCPLCGAALIVEPEGHDAEPPGNRHGVSSPKRRL